MTSKLHHSPSIFIAAILVAVLATLLPGYRAPARLEAAPAYLTLPGNTPRPVLEHTARLLGPYTSTQPLHLVIGLQPPQLAEEQQFLRDLQDPRSPSFHHFLSSDAWNKRFSPTPAAEQAVVQWAQGAGLRVVHRFPNRLLVSVEATPTVIQRLLNIQLNRYELGGTTFFSNDRDPTIPGSLAGIVHSIAGLDNLADRPASKHGLAHVSYHPAPASGPFVRLKETLAFGGKRRAEHRRLTPRFRGGLVGLEPPDLWSSQGYDDLPLQAQVACCNPLQNPSGSPPETSIGILTAADFQFSDLNAFAAKYGLAGRLDVFQVDGSSPCCNGGGSFEATMDVEYAVAMAHSTGTQKDGVHVFVYEAPNASNGQLQEALNQMANDGFARSYSTSWGNAETLMGSGTMDDWHAIYDQMLGEGWTLAAASGDHGSTDDCQGISVDYPASDPDVVAAGGTTLTMNNAGNFVSDVTWSGTGCKNGLQDNHGGGGGGCSTKYLPLAAQQVDLCGNKRNVPDVALNANSCQEVFFNGGFTCGGGTSIVAPELAGFFAHENAYLLSLGPICGGGSCAPLGDPHSALELATINPTNPYYDITTGCNASFLDPGKCATPGYDLATGHGSFNALQLAWAINRWVVDDGHAPWFLPGNFPFKYNRTDVKVTWTMQDVPVGADLAASGVAGFTAGWDSIPADPSSHATPGSGDAFYNGPQTLKATQGSIQLAGAGQGAHTLMVRVWDHAGNTRLVTYGPYYYDTVPPVTSAQLAGTPAKIQQVGHPEFTSPVQVTLKATDATSGVAKTIYTVDCNSLCAIMPYNGSFKVDTNGTHAVSFYSVDKAGNYEKWETQTFYINITP